MDLYTDRIGAIIRPLREAGFALQWAHPRTKKPIGDDWAAKPVASIEQLLLRADRGNNLSVRLGEYSRVGGGFLHVIDIDIRVPAEAAAARARLAELLPDYDANTAPTVLSGSGGESRHHYFISDRPFHKKRLAHSGKKFTGSDGKPHWTWEIDLFGTGVHVLLPPSIHPDTGRPYRWLREFDFESLEFGIVPFVPASLLESLGAAGAADANQGDTEVKPPLGLTAEQSAKALRDLPVADFCDDREGWLQVGMALHHEYGGSDVGFRLWDEFSKRSDKYDATDMRRVWKSFRTSKSKPVRMATIVQAAGAARLANMFDEEPEETGDALSSSKSVQSVQNNQVSGDALDDDILGPSATLTPEFDDGLDDILGAPARAEPEFDDGLDDAAVLSPAGAAALNWVSLLGLNEEGAVKPTLHNLTMIVRNDPRLIGLPQLNEFTQETVQRTPPGTKARRRKNQAKDVRQLGGRIWDIKDRLNGELWSDDRDFAIRDILEAPETQGGYNIKVSDRDLKAAIVLAANDHAFHPVREYLEGIKWDGTPRVEALFTTYLGSPNDSYTRSVSRLMMVAAVTRIFEPGHKFDFAVILEGLQGKRKSTFIQILGRNWFAELDGDFADSKTMIELMQGAWIMEIPELSSFQRGEVRSIKAFISRQRDRARLAYARRAGSFPRQCIFIGSTNDREYLKDDSGGRRFWPMLCALQTEIDTDALEANVDQLWAEALAMYNAMRAEKPHGTLPLYLTCPEAKAQAARLQESRRVESADDALAGRIGAWLDKPAFTGSLDDDTGSARRRDITCLVQIWVEALGNDARTYDNGKAQMIGRAMTKLGDWTQGGGVTAFETYGRQRFYTRFGMDREDAKFGV